DRKSTRLNSSHLVISYAVFCLKKKTSGHRIIAGSISPDETVRLREVEAAARYIAQEKTDPLKHHNHHATSLVSGPTTHSAGSVQSGSSRHRPAVASQDSSEIQNEAKTRAR